MKKIFTLLSLMMFCALSVVAADNYRRTWDFRNGYSATTLEIMAQDTKNWTVQPTGFQNTKHSTTTPVMEFGGEEIVVPEFEGLTVGAFKDNAHLQVYDGKSNNSSFPANTACLWLNGGKGNDYVEFVVPAGENVKFGYCSHSNSQARGFKTSSAGFADAEGNTQWTSKADATIQEVEIINSNTEEAKLKIAATNGAHIYYIIIGAGDAAQEYKIGYLYYDAAGDGFAELPLYQAVSETEHFTYEPINVNTTTPAKEALMAYDAVVIDGTVPADFAAAIKDNMYWQPVVNFSPALAEALGYGTLLASESELAYVTDARKPWFEGFENWAMDNCLAVSNGEVMPVPMKVTGHNNIQKYIVAGGEEFAYPDSVVAYVYNSGHNQYTYYGVAGDYSADTYSILNAVIKETAASKTDVTACPKPGFTAEYGEMVATVTLNCLNKNAVIYYTTDGTEPTIESNVYTEPLTFTAETTIKAVAIADGYTVSEANAFDVKLYHQAQSPKVYATYADSEKNSDAVVSLSSTEGDLVDIWYNFTGSNDTLRSSKYVEPITLKNAATITAFAIGKEEGTLVMSEPTTADIKANMLNVRRDQVAHFTADTWNTLDNLVLDGTKQEKWYNGSNYYFTWGKSAQKSFEEIGDPITDESGEPITDENGNFVYNTQDKPVSVTENTADPDWKITSRGQVMIFQSNTVSEAIGDFNGYNPERAEDIIEGLATKNDIQFGGKASGDKNTATIESTKAYEGKLSIVAIVANINGDKTTGVGSTAKVAIQVSADGTNWETVGDTLTTGKIYRNYKKLEVFYDAETPVYVRLASVSGTSQGVHDIYVFNHGEKSAAAEEEYTGIDEVNEAATATSGQAVRVLKNGQVLIIKDGSVFTVAGAKIK